MARAQTRIPRVTVQHRGESWRVLVLAEDPIAGRADVNGLQTTRQAVSA